jgi:hypothetical protein
MPIVGGNWQKNSLAPPQKIFLRFFAELALLLALGLCRLCLVSIDY